MVKARGSEALEQLRVEPLVLSEDDPGHHGASFSVEPASARVRDSRAQAVAEAQDASPPPYGAAPVSAQDDVDAVLAQIRTLVEALARFGSPRPGDARHDLEHRPLRRGAAKRELEPRRLGGREIAESQDPNGDAKGELGAPRGARHLDPRERRAADLVDEHAPVERVQPGAPPPPAGREDGGDERRRPQAWEGERGEQERARADDHRDARRAGQERSRQARAERERDQMWRRDRLERSHSWTSGFSCSRRAGPIPGTASSSSIDENAPFAAR